MFAPVPFPVHASACSLIHVIAAARVVGVLVSRAIALRLLLASEWQIRMLLGLFDVSDAGMDSSEVSQSGRLATMLGWMINCFGSVMSWLGIGTGWVSSNDGNIIAQMVVLAAQLGVAAVLWTPDKRPRKAALWALLAGVVVETLGDAFADVEVSGFIADLAKIGSVALAAKLCL
jgi:hypothetical protein